MKLSGTIEIDETFELESQKGCRKIQRKARKRGGPSSYRGLFHEQVCIVTTTDRNGHEIFKAVGYGKPTKNSILENFLKNLDPKSIFYSDGAFCYDELAKKANCSLVQLKITFVIQHRRTYQYSEQYTFANKRSIGWIQGYRNKIHEPIHELVCICS